MAFMTAVVFDEKTGRHELHFVNQQYDFLMYIAWDESKRDYALEDGRLTEAQASEIARGSGCDHFDLATFLTEARSILPLRDREQAERRSKG
jgi:DUF1680 family protein